MPLLNDIVRLGKKWQKCFVLKRNVCEVTCVPYFSNGAFMSKRILKPECTYLIS